MLRNAIVAVEDADFWKHLGVNPWRVPGAALANLRSGRHGQGSSTLTMQLSRLLFLTPEKTLRAQDQGDHPRLPDREELHQGGDLHPLLQPGLLRPRQLRGGGGQPVLLRQVDQGPDAAPRRRSLAGLPQNARPPLPRRAPRPRARSAATTSSTAWLEEKYISAAEAEAAQGRAARPAACKQRAALHRAPLPRGGPQVPREEYGSQRIYQGGLRVYTTLDPACSSAANARAAQRACALLDRRARGFVTPEATVLKDGLLPEPLHLDEWDRPVAAGDVVRGVVLASDRMTRRRPDRRLPGAARPGRRSPGPAARTWPRCCPRGTVAPFRIVGPRRRRRDARRPRSLLEQEPKVRGRAPRPRRARRARCGPWSAATTSSAASSTARPRPCARWAPPSSPSSTPPRSRRWADTPATIIVDAPLSFPNPWNKHGLVAAQLRLQVPGPDPAAARPLEQSRNIPAVKTLQAVGVETGIEYAHKLGLAGRAAALPAHRPRRGRGHASWR